MKTLSLRFVTEPGWQSAAIRNWTGGRFSHAGIMPPLGMFGDGTYELGARSGIDKALGNKPGVQLRPYDYASFSDQDYVHIPVSQDEWAQFWYWAKRQIGCPYSYRTIAGFVLGRELRDKGHWDCSTYIAWCLVQAKLFPESLRDSLQQISPNELWRLAQLLVYWRRDWSPIPLIRTRNAPPRRMAV